jgi:short-subunit dehydrogenase involved in D-alanine esterification of teichoic acids
MKLGNNTIFITGGSSGIGLALAKAFSALDNTVIVCGRNLEKLESVENSYPIHTIQCDITKEDEVQQALGKIKTEFNGLNILVNNAGIQYNYDFYEDENALEKIEDEISINFLAQVKLTKLFLPILMKQPEAAIINVSSGLGIVPKESAPVYCATKAAVHIFSKSLRYQLEKTPVKVFEIIPSLVDTDMTKGRGKGKISPETLAKEVITNLEKDSYEIRVGKVKLLFLINRLMPSLAERILRKG